MKKKFYICNREDSKRKEDLKGFIRASIQAYITADACPCAVTSCIFLTIGARTLFRNCKTPFKNLPKVDISRFRELATNAQREKTLKEKEYI